MLKNVFSQFNNLNKSQEKYYCTAINDCDYVSKICNEIGDQATTNSNKNTKMMNDLKDHIQNDIEKIESNIIVETKKVISYSSYNFYFNKEVESFYCF